jgi:DNA-binding XRE family transcriptional regulator
MGMTLPQWRTTASKTQAWIAQKTGINQSTISRYETGDATPSLKHALLIRDATGGAVAVDSWSQIPRATASAESAGPEAA